jgi:hypothetical protein
MAAQPPAVVIYVTTSQHPNGPGIKPIPALGPIVAHIGATLRMPASVCEIAMPLGPAGEPWAGYASAARAD